MITMLTSQFKYSESDRQMGRRREDLFMSRTLQTPRGRHGAALG